MAPLCQDVLKEEEEETMDLIQDEKTLAFFLLPCY